MNTTFPPTWTRSIGSSAIRERNGEIAISIEKKSSEVMLAISCDNREAVDQMNDAAAEHGGNADINPTQDLGFLYNRSLADPDGHVWEAVWMDKSGFSSATD